MTDLEHTALVLGILASVAALITTFLKLRKWAKRRQQSAEEALSREVAQLEAAGGTIGSRTDIGFYVVLVLGSLRTDSLAAYVASAITLIVVVGCMVMIVGIATCSMALGAGPTVVTDEFALKALAVVANLFLGLSTISYWIGSSMRTRASNFENRVRSIWAKNLSEHRSRQARRGDGS